MADVLICPVREVAGDTGPNGDVEEPPDSICYQISPEKKG